MNISHKFQRSTRDKSVLMK